MQEITNFPEPLPSPIHSQALTNTARPSTLYLYVLEVIYNVSLQTYKPPLRRHTNRFMSLASRFVAKHSQAKITKHKTHAGACTNTRTTTSFNERV